MRDAVSTQVNPGRNFQKNFFKNKAFTENADLSEISKNAPSYAYRSVVKENRENNQLFDVLLIITVLNYCFDFRS